MCVISRGIGHDACPPLALVESGERIEGATELEGTHPLQVFTFEEKLGTDFLVHGTRAEYRGAMGEALNPLRCSADIRECRELLHVVSP